MKAEYREGTNVAKEFERAMKRLFQTPQKKQKNASVNLYPRFPQLFCRHCDI
jgi:hypothetical protein